MGRLARLCSARSILTLFLMVCIYNVGRYSAPCYIEEKKPAAPLAGLEQLDTVHLNRDLRMDTFPRVDTRKDHQEEQFKNLVISDSKPVVPKSNNDPIKPFDNPPKVTNIPKTMKKDPPKSKNDLTKTNNQVHKILTNKSLTAKDGKVLTSLSKNQVVKPKPIQPAPVQALKVTSKLPVKGQSNSKGVLSKASSSNSYTAKDYYGTGTIAHHEALRKMGAESVSKHSFKSPFIIDPHIYSRSTIRKPPGTRKLKVISCFNCPERFYTSHKYNNDFQQCPYSECRLTTTAGMNPDADVMMFWQDPEVRPPPKPKHQAWIYMSWETPPHRSYPKPENLWLDKFNWTISYRLNADFMLPYDQMYWRDQSLLKPDSFYLTMAKGKTKMATWWVSHCETRSHREQYVKELQKYIEVDVYGACGNLTCERALDSECHRNLNNSYRYYLSFENSFCHDYVTEKFFKVFRYRFNTIPVVRSSFNYEKYLPPNILINAEKFPSPKELADHLKALAKDPYRYAMMLKEKDRLGILNRKIDWCDFCEKLHTGKFKNQVIHNVKEFTSEGGRCWDKVIKN